MNLFAMKATYPLDSLTIKEIKSLYQKSQLKDAFQYDSLLREESWSDANARGFFVLAYDDDENSLIGVINAFDTLGLNAFEWSIVMDPDYRNLGIEQVLIEGLKHGLDERQAAGEMVAVFPQQQLEDLLKENGYVYSSAKILMQAVPMPSEVESLQVMPYRQQDLVELQEMMADGFGDMPEETAEFVQLIEEEESSRVWIARKDNQTVATITTALEGRTLWITAFTTASKYREQGIALELLNWAKNYASEKEFSALALEVETDNPKALSLYTKAGFVNKEQIDYYIVD